MSPISEIISGIIAIDNCDRKEICLTGLVSSEYIVITEACNDPTLSIPLS